MTLPETMTVAAFHGHGEPEVLKSAREPLPTLGQGEVLIEVRAAGVNRPDVLQRMGAYPPPSGASPLPGLEAAGLVASVGEGVSRFRVGDSVTALLPGGGYAEYAKAHEGSVLPIPEELDFLAAAALPETYMTVWHNVFQRGALKGGETLLVHGGTSGIGTTAIQLAKAFGATVITTVGSEAKCEAARKLGADLAINYRTQEFVEEVKRFTDGKGADVILDMVGGDYASRNIHAAALDGRIVSIAQLNGSDVRIDLGRLMIKRLTLTGSTLRARDLAFKAALAADLKKSVWPLLSNGMVAPLIEKIYPLSKAADAHRHMDEDHIGKIMLVPDAFFGGAAKR